MKMNISHAESVEMEVKGPVLLYMRIFALHPRALLISNIPKMTDIVLWLSEEKQECSEQ